MRAVPIGAATFARVIGVFFPSLENDRKIAIAVSGGADSMALAFLLARWRDGLKGAGAPAPRLFALTVDHGLRQGSAREAKQVGRWMRSFGVAHKTLKWQGPKPSADVQAAARAARYRLMLDWCHGRKVRDLVLAHHLEDQAETFLIRLARGSGVDGLSAMAAASEREDVRLLRPLLDLPRRRLRATLEQEGHSWIEDPSNDDARFLRVRARRALPFLEELGLSAERLADTAGRMARARAALDASTAEFLASHVTFHPEGYAAIATAGFRALPDEIALRALVVCLKTVGGLAYPPRHDRLQAIHAALRSDGVGKGRTLGGCKFVEEASRILVFREMQAAQAAPAVKLKPGERDVWDNRFDVALRRGAARGGEVRALGADGLAELRQVDAPLPDSVPDAAAAGLPALWRGKRLLAAPHAGYAAPGAPVFTASFRETWNL